MLCNELHRDRTVSGKGERGAGTLYWPWVHHRGVGDDVFRHVQELQRFDIGDDEGRNTVQLVGPAGKVTIL